MCKVRIAAYQALACYSAADLDEAQLLRPLKEYGLLLLEEADESALQQCSKLVKSMLQYEHSIRRRWGMTHVCGNPLSCFTEAAGYRHLGKKQ